MYLQPIFEILLVQNLGQLRGLFSAFKTLAILLGLRRG